MTERISGLRSKAKVTRNENVKIVFRVYLPEKQIDLKSDEDQNYSRQILHISPITLRQRKRIILGRGSPRPHPGWARLNCLTNTDPNFLPFTTYTESCPVRALFGLRCVRCIRCIRCGVSSHRNFCDILFCLF